MSEIESNIIIMEDKFIDLNKIDIIAIDKYSKLSGSEHSYNGTYYYINIVTTNNKFNFCFEKRRWQCDAFYGKIIKGIASIKERQSLSNNQQEVTYQCKKCGKQFTVKHSKYAICDNCT